MDTKLKLPNNIYQRIVAAKVFIDNNYYDDIDLEQIASQASLSRFHFHRLFTSIYKITPHQYLTQTRIDAAKELLKKEGISITEVCNSIGFESLGSFSSLFRRQSGFSPQYYRNIAWIKAKLAKEQPRRFIPHCFIEQYKVCG
jgi:AraC-like DNA-binding protein